MNLDFFFRVLKYFFPNYSALLLRFLILQIIQETLVLIHLNISIIIIKVVTTTTKITTTLPLPQLQQPIDQVPQIEVRMGKLTTER